MGINPYIVLGSAVVGFLVGLTGAGGGALMTPMLILLFAVKPSTAISSDLVAAVVMRPVGAARAPAKGTVNLRLVGWMVARLGPDGLPRVPTSCTCSATTRRPNTNSDRCSALALLLGAGGDGLR